MKRARPDKNACKDDGLSATERVCSLLREIQWHTNCSTITLQRLLDSLRGRLGESIKECETSGCDLPRQAHAADKKMDAMVSVSLKICIASN